MEFTRTQSSIAVVVGALAIAAVTLGSTAGAQAPAATSDGANASGRVVDALTGDPVPGAIVSYTTVAERYTPGISGPVAGRGSVEADAQGGFVVPAAGAVGMHVSAVADGYLPGAFGQRSPNGPDAMLRFAKGRDAVIGLWKYASISGAVTDAGGKPLEGVEVQAFRLSAAAGDEYAAESDAQGRYTIDGLPPGMYKVAAVLAYATTPATLAAALERDDAAGTALRAELARSDTFVPETGGIRSGAFVFHRPVGIPGDDPGIVTPTQFFPASPTPLEAEVMHLAAGEERQFVDFRLAAIPATRLSGIVTGPDGPAAHVGVQLLSIDSSLPRAALIAASGVTNGAGEFTMLGVAPGQYELHAFVRGIPEPSAPLRDRVPGTFSNLATQAMWGSTPISVAAPGVAGVQLTMLPGPAIAGIVEAEATGARTRSSIPRTLILEPVDPRMTSVQIAIDADGGFRATGVAPGDYFVTMPPDSEWAMSSAIAGGRDVSREPLSLRDGDQFIRVTATDRLSALAVSVTTRTADGLVTMFVFPARRNTPAPDAQHREIALMGSDANVLQVLPPGLYSVVAVGEGAFDSHWREPHILDRLERVASQATVREGQTTQLSIAVVDMK